MYFCQDAARQIAANCGAWIEPSCFGSEGSGIGLTYHCADDFDAVVLTIPSATEANQTISKAMKRSGLQQPDALKATCDDETLEVRLRFGVGAAKVSTDRGWLLCSRCREMAR